MTIKFGSVSSVAAPAMAAPVVNQQLFFKRILARDPASEEAQSVRKKIHELFLICIDHIPYPILSDNMEIFTV